MAANEAFSALYARARDIQADYLFDEMDRVERETLAGIHHPQAVSVVLASKRWRAAMMAPKRYGDRSNVDLSVTERNPTDTEIAARVASLVALEKMKNENSGD
ncbi:MAG: hypothetical protein LBE24_04065 [Methylobacillus sp.]|nr:hypothetical protein [Methylobacillus sp.]